MLVAQPETANVNPFVAKWQSCKSAGEFYGERAKRNCGKLEGRKERGGRAKLQKCEYSEHNTVVVSEELKSISRLSDCPQKTIFVTLRLVL